MHSTTLKPLRLEVAELETSPLPIDLDLVKEHLAVDGNDNDALITQCLLSAISWAEGSMRRTIFAREHVWVLQDFPQCGYGEIHLPRGKTQSVASVAYSLNGTTYTLTGPSSGSPAGTDYQEDLRGSNGGVIMPPRMRSWPGIDLDVPSPVVITFTAGWNASDVPANVVQAILFAVSDAFELRGSADITMFGRNFETREILIAPYKLKRWY